MPLYLVATYVDAREEWAVRADSPEQARALVGDDPIGERIGGFIGPYELCMSMAEALTAWEAANGMLEAYENAGVSWIEVVEQFVQAVLETALETDELPEPAKILPEIRLLQHLR